MFDLPRILARLGPVFLFLLLEGICVYLLVRFNEDQNRIFWSSANAVTGRARKNISQVNTYFGLQSSYDSLLAENARLRMQLKVSQYDIAVSTDTVRDDSSHIPLYAYVPARVVNNSTAGERNWITLDKGRAQGVQAHQGVITDKGVLGVVVDVSKHFASVMSILNARTRITADIKGEGVFGALVWKGDDPRYMSLEDVPRHYFLEIGDTVQTSVYSQLFPPGIPIGRIDEFSVPPGASNYQIKVELFTDMRKIRHGYVVQHSMKEELQELEQDE